MQAKCGNKSSYEIITHLFWPYGNNHDPSNTSGHIIFLLAGNLTGFAIEAQFIVNHKG
jgi:hypothetical protein